MIYTILVALDADPLLPRCRFIEFADLVLRWLSMIYETRVTGWQPGSHVRELFIYQKRKGFAASFPNSIHAGEARSEADSEQVPRIKGLRRGMLRSHGNGSHKGK